jgi:prepilin-type N-terminal cleavage/methylation domain-containing protein
MSTSAPHRRTDRSAFTLIELLVVVAIIAILVGLVAGGLFRAMGASSTGRTKTLIQRLDNRLKQQYAYAIDRFRNEIPGSTAINLSGNDKKRAQVIHTKLRLKQWFPANFAEVFSGAGPNPYGPLTSYTTYLRQLGVTSGGYPPQPYESAVCLKMVLERGPESAGESELSASNAVQYINGVLPAYVDSWGQPLLFVRWPTGDLAPGGTGGTGFSPLNPTGYQGGPPWLDPVDPEGKLAASQWWGTSARSQFEAVCHPLPPARTSLKLIPVIVSAGPDKQLGLDPFPVLNVNTLYVNSPTATFDDIYNFNQ